MWTERRSRKCEVTRRETRGGGNEGHVHADEQGKKKSDARLVIRANSSIRGEFRDILSSLSTVREIWSEGKSGSWRSSLSK